jgi:large subunit ribosomal protein L29
MKYSEIKDLSNKELIAKINDLENQKFEAQIKNKIGQLTNPLMIRKIRRDIAKIKTAVAQKGKV